MGEQSQFDIWSASGVTRHREISKSHSYSAFGNLRRREAMDENRPSPLGRISDRSSQLRQSPSPNRWRNSDEPRIFLQKSKGEFW